MISRISKKELLALFNKNKPQFLALSIAAVVLFVLCCGDIFDKSSETMNETAKEVHTLENELEHKIEDFLKTVDGVGKVKVCILFDYLEETSYAINEDKDTDEYSSEYIIIEDTDGRENGLPIRIRAPLVRGVAVSCEGATSAKVKNEITALLTAALGITANRVHISPYSDN